MDKEPFQEWMDAWFRGLTDALYPQEQQRRAEPELQAGPPHLCSLCLEPIAGGIVSALNPQDPYSPGCHQRCALEHHEQERLFAKQCASKQDEFRRRLAEPLPQRVADLQGAVEGLLKARMCLRALCQVDDADRQELFDLHQTLERAFARLRPIVEREVGEREARLQS